MFREKVRGGGEDKGRGGGGEGEMGAECYEIVAGKCYN